MKGKAQPNLSSFVDGQVDDKKQVDKRQVNFFLLSDGAVGILL